MKTLQIVFTFLFFTTQIILAQVPQTTSFQGVLTDSEGAVVADGDYSLNFKLYNSATEGTMLWEETQAVSTSGGVFNLILGSVTPLDLDFESGYWIEMSIDGGEPLSPRVELTSSFYSLMSKSVEDSTISTVKLQDNSVTTEKLADGVITQEKLSPSVSIPPGGEAGGDLVGSYPNPSIVDNAITSTKVADNTLTSDDIATNVISSIDGVDNDGGNVDLVGGSNITITPDNEANTITISADGVGGGDVTSVEAGDGLTGGGSGGDVALNVVGGNGISVTADEVALNTTYTDGRYVNIGEANSVTSAMIIDKQINTADLASNSVNSSIIADNTITSADIAANILSSIDGVSNDGGNVDLVAGSNVTITPNDEANTITISAATAAGDNLGNHTATQNIKLNGNYLSGDGGNEGVFVASNGNVGLKTTSPATHLHINGSPVSARGQLSISAPAGEDAFLSFYEGNNFKSYLWYDDSEDDLSLQNYNETTGGDLNLNPYGGNVGIGTNSPNANLEVSGINGALFTGSFESGSIPAQGNGTRMMWYPKKAAFRVGYAYGVQWDDGNIGNYSVAMGQNTIAFGTNSMATGLYSVAYGDYAVALGYNNNAQDYATAFGTATVAGGTSSTSMGYLTRADSYISTAIGRFNIGGGSATSWIGTDPLLEVGIGTSSSDRKNALTILKNGNVGIGIASPIALLHVVGTNVVATMGSNIDGVYGASNASGGSGVAGINTGSGNGIYGRSTSGKAGKFDGDVEITGTLSKGSGTFKIDHPLDPANKYLYHSFVESPDMMNIYNGNVVTDGDGNANVILPDWFEALNIDFRYQLTVIGSFAQAIISEEVNSNQFSIRTDKPNVKVSWQVTGVRNDPYARANRIQVEENKPEKERGRYLHPISLGLPESKGMGY